MVTPVKYECDYKKCNRYFCKIENFVYIEINERSFSIPTPGRQQAIALNNLLLTGPHANKIVEILIKYSNFQTRNYKLETSFAKRQPCFLGHNVLANVEFHMSLFQVMQSNVKSRFCFALCVNDSLSYLHNVEFTVSAALDVE